MALLADMLSYIDTQTSLTKGTDLFGGDMPPSPIQCVAVYESSSAPPIELMGPTNPPPLERPRIQVLVRAADYSTGRALADTVWRALSKISNQTIGSTRYLRVAAVDSPTFIERDENHRPIFSTNFDVVKAT